MSAAKLKLEEEHKCHVTMRCLQRAVVKYENNGYVFDVRDAPRSGRKRILGIVGDDEVKIELRKQPLRKVARTRKSFESAKGVEVVVSRTTLQRSAKVSGLVVSIPKRVRISYHCSHHKCSRMVYCKLWSDITQYRLRRMLYGDEMSFPMHVSFNSKNDVFMVAAGQQPFTNIHRYTKGDEGKFVSLYLVCNYWGIVAWYVFFEKFTKRLYQDTLLSKILKPRIQTLRRCGQSPTLYYHDHATNSDLHDDEKMIDSVFGTCKVIPFCKPICNEQQGREFIEPEDRKSYWRAKIRPKKVCTCEMNELAVPSASPTLNLVENVNGYLRTVWQRECGPNGGLSWYGGKKRRIDVLDKCIRIVNSDKSFFRKLYDHAHIRHEHVATNGGDLYTES